MILWRQHLPLTIVVETNPLDLRAAMVSPEISCQDYYLRLQSSNIINDDRLLDTYLNILLLPPTAFEGIRPAYG
jgi:hypothetical protein